MKRRIITGILIITLLGGGIYIRRNSVKKSNITAVKTSTVVNGNVKSYLSTTAVIKSKNSKDYFGQQLKVSKVHVKIGDSVKQGQILVTFDVSDLNNNIKQTEIQYNNSLLQRKDLYNQRDQINKKIEDLDTQIKELQSKNTLNPAEAAELKTLKNSRDNIQRISDEKIKQQDNAVALAKLAYDNAKAKLGEGKENITTEFDGVVTSVNVLEGGIGSPAQPAVTVQDITNLKAVVSIGKYDAAKIGLEQPAEIKNNGEILKGKVSFIDPVARKTMGAAGAETILNTEIDILDKSEGLKVDFDADVNILLGEKANVVKIPAEAVKSDKNGNAYVFVVENGKAVEKTLKLGLQSDIEAEVLEGLKVGEKVILNPIASVKSGTLVEEVR
jgi:HlyD family secretion protein